VSLSVLAESDVAVRVGAGFWIRALARIIDTAIHTALSFVTGLGAGLIVILASVVHGTSPDPVIAKLSTTTIHTFLASIVGMITLHTVAEGLHGSTIGKRICGLTVVSEDGSPALPLAALRRSVAYFWDALFFGAIGAIKMAESPEHQRYGDDWARTQVVRLSSFEGHTHRSWARFFAANAAALSLDALILVIGIASKM
jgi:uncharacterized RDD family membrane protein YckC